MNILGIDQSYTSTGIYFNRGKEVSHQTITTVVDKDDPLEKFRRAEEICDAISTIIDENEIKHVGIEGISMGNVRGNSNRDLAGLQYAIVGMILRRYNDEVSVAIYPPTQVKKHATGKGNCKKEDMFEALPLGVYEHLSGYLKTRGRYDVTDAYWVWSIATDDVNNKN